MFESDKGIVLFVIKTKNNGVSYLNNFSALDVKARLSLIVLFVIVGTD